MKVSSHSGATSYTLLLILLVYFALASLFALKTPPWQNPDEPAHYNYVAYVATEWRLPVLAMGDYDGAYLQRLKAERFPPDLSIESVRYEFHQPPLYYLLAAPAFLLSGGRGPLLEQQSVSQEKSEDAVRNARALLAVRLFSVALGAGVVLLVFLCARTVLPAAPYIALGAAAFAAFLPMHVAVMASVNNDALAELVIAGAILALLRWQKEVARQDGGEGPPVSDRRYLLITAVLIGVGFLTKATAYILLPVALVVVIAGSARAFAGGQAGWKGARRLLYAREQLVRYAILIAPALLLGLPWWIRNTLLYGNLDFLGLAWHDEVVSGQPTAAAWIAEHGWSAYWERAWTFTSKSFWGVFGWLGVFMDARVYTALAVLSVMAGVGVLFWWRRRANHDTTDWPRFLTSPWTVLLLLWLATFAAYGWYNLGFIQHQGRYLFPALPVWSLLFAGGWWAVLERRASIAAGGVLLVAAAAHGIAPLLLGGMVNKWTLLLYGAGAIGLLLHGLLSARVVRLVMGEVGVSEGDTSSEPLRPILYVCLFLALIALDIAIPFLYIVPQLHA